MGAAGRKREPSPDQALDRLFQALSDPTRRRLLAQLALGPAKVTDLARPFRMSLPAVSKHLKILEEAHLLTRSVDGRVHRLTLRGEPLRHVEIWLDPFRSYWEHHLAALGRDLREHPSPRRGSEPGPPRRRKRGHEG